MTSAGVGMELVDFSMSAQFRIEATHVCWRRISIVLTIRGWDNESLRCGQWVRSPRPMAP
jgi:hypothetical protein